MKKRILTFAIYVSIVFSVSAQTISGTTLKNSVASVSLGSSSSLNSSSSESNYTSTDNIKKAQVAMATNEYIVTPGDIYSLVFSGGSFSISVDSTYKVRIANLGIINAKGLTLQEFKNKVESLIVSNYPTGGVQFFLSNPAQFHVFIKGEVDYARTIETWALERASKILSEYYTNYSSNRFFKIISEDGTEKSFDLFKAMRDGDFSQDPYLRPGDTIVVPKIDRQVEIKGAVFRPGIYELKKDEELSSLIFDYADGFTPFAMKDKIEVLRFTGKSNSFDSAYYKETDLISDIPLSNFDKVYIPSVKDIQSVIFVEGAIVGSYVNERKASDVDEQKNITGSVVSSPAGINKMRFEYSENKSFVQFILENSKIFVNSADLSNAYVLRNNPKDESSKIIETDINKILYPSKDDSPFEDFALMANDKIIVPYTQYYVTVIGGVNSGGKYAYQPGKKWNYYINLANGFDYDQNLFKVVKITDKDGKKLSKKSEIPPESIIYASRNSPRNGWLIPLLSTIMSFITACLGFYGTMAGLFK